MSRFSDEIKVNEREWQMGKVVNKVDQRGLTELLNTLRRNNIKLQTKGTNIQYEAPRSAVDSVLIDGLRRFKPTLLKMLNKNTLDLDIVVPLKHSDKTSAYVICVHTGHGGVMDYRHFAEHMGEKYGIFGIQALDLLKKQPAELSVEKLAQIYVDIILSRFNDAPIILYGISAGGLISLEMACLLRDMNQPPQLVVFGDTLDMVFEDLEYKSYMGRMQWINFIEAYLPVEILAIRSNGTHLWDLKSEGHEFWVLNTHGRFEYLIEKSHEFNHKRALVELTVQDMSTHFDIHKSLTTAYFYYQPKPYDGPSLFVKASETSWAKSSNIREQLVGNVRIEEIEGIHVDIIHDPGCRKVADFVQEYV